MMCLALSLDEEQDLKMFW